MSGLDLETAVRAKVPITTVLLNNGGMATYAPGNFATARERFGVSHMVGDYAKDRGRPRCSRDYRDENR